MELFSKKEINLEFKGFLLEFICDVMHHSKMFLRAGKYSLLKIKLINNLKALT